MFSNGGSPVLFRIAGKAEEFGVIIVAGLGKFNKPFGETKTKISQKVKLVFADQYPIASLLLPEGVDLHVPILAPTLSTVDQ